MSQVYGVRSRSIELDPDTAEILLVEDNPGDVRLIEEAFKYAHIEITLHVVVDGDEALDFCYQRGEYEKAPRPDLILLDLNLPRMNGDAVLKEIGSDSMLKRLPVIVFTGSDAPEDIARSYDLNANAYLTKPVDPDEYIETVRLIEQFWLLVARLPPVDG